MTTLIPKFDFKNSGVTPANVLDFGADYSAEDAKVQTICAAIHAPEVVDAYEASLVKLELS